LHEASDQQQQRYFDSDAAEEYQKHGLHARQYENLMVKRNQRMSAQAYTPGVS